MTLGATAEPASAGPGFFIHVYNKMTRGDVALVAARGEDCWHTDDLGRSADENAVAPGKAKTLYTEKSTRAFTSCFIFGGARGIEFKLKEPGGAWYVPGGSPPNYQIEYQNHPSKANAGFNFLGGVRTWLPRKDGHGLVCFHTVTNTHPRNFEIAGVGGGGGAVRGIADIYVYDDAHCNIAVPADAPPTGAWDTQAQAEERANTPATGPPAAGTPPPARDAAHPAQAGSGQGAIVDLLSTIGVACPWYAFPGDTTRCDAFDVGNPANWTLRELSTDVRDFKINSNVGTNDPRSSVATAQVSIPKNSPPGTLTASNSVNTGWTATNSTTNGGRLTTSLGFKQSAKVGVQFFGEVGVEFTQTIAGEWNYSTTDSKTTEDKRTRTVSISAGAAPGYTTTLDVFTTKRSANYLYSADLDFGELDGVQAVVTPANPALDQSPARRQPCLGYVVGDQKVRNSLVYVGKQLLDAGFSPHEPTLSADRAAFLASMGQFFADGTCPGFPSGYASRAGFKGSGVGSYENLGYDAEGKPVQVFTGCVYQAPFPATRSQIGRLMHNRLASPTARPAANRGACQDVSANGTVSDVQPGNLVDARNVTPPRGGARDAAVITASPGPDEILGPDAGGTIYTNNGTPDIVRAGRGPTRVIGGSGENHLYGGAGTDTLIGGRGGSNYLYAGSGRDTLQQSNGFAEMEGGAGVDTFLGDNMTGVMAGGSGASRMVATGDMSHLQMLGGSGSNVYVLRGHGTPTILQPPSRAPSTLMTDRSIRVPAYVKRAVATGSRPVTLTGSIGTLSLQANNARDRLVSGPGPEVLRGGRGRDTFVFNDENDNIARGGTGPDRYVFTGTPELFARPPALQYPAQRTAATIIGFSPRKGDRLVLSRAVFGAGLRGLERGFRIVAAQNPRPSGPGATLLFDTRTRILSFDPDGSGRISDKVIVRLPGFHTVKRSWIVFTR